jgi:hypothetical protein
VAGAGDTEYYLPAGNHVIDLADGRAVVPGNKVKLTNKQAEDPHNKAYIENGVLIKVEGGD